MNINLYTAVIGIGSVVFLFLIKSSLKNFLLRIGLSPRISDLLAKAGPVAALIITTVVVGIFGLDNSGVKIVGEVPKGLPSIALPPVDMNLWVKLIVPALLISIVGYVESISVALTFAAKKRQRVDPDQELIALGASNIGAGIIGWISCYRRSFTHCS